MQIVERNHVDSDGTAPVGNDDRAFKWQVVCARNGRATDDEIDCQVPGGDTAARDLKRPEVGSRFRHAWVWRSEGECRKLVVANEQRRGAGRANIIRAVL